MVEFDPLASLRELHEQRFNLMDKALALQALEYSRRLDELNHTHERMAEKERDFVSRETFETFVKRYEESHERLRQDIITTAKISAEARSQIALSIAAASNEQNMTLDRRFDNLEEKLAGDHEANRLAIDSLARRMDLTEGITHGQQRRSNGNLTVLTVSISIVFLIMGIVGLVVSLTA